MKSLQPGDCVKLREGTYGRVRAKLENDKWKVRVRRANGSSHHFLVYASGELKKTSCPKGWMSPEGYNRYLKTTLRKMKERQKKHVSDRN